MPELVFVGEDFGIDDCESLETINVASLEYVGEDLYLRDLVDLTGTYTFQNLTYIDSDLTVGGCGITSLAFPSLEKIGYVEIVDNDSLTTITMPALLRVDGDFIASGNALTESAVDYILAKLVSLDGTDGTTLWENLTLTLTGGTNAPPSEDGLDDVAILEGRGCTVNVNTP